MQCWLQSTMWLEAKFGDDPLISTSKILPDFEENDN